MSNLKIIKQLVSNTSYKNGTNNGKKYITVHMTGNTRNGATAQMHANLQSNGNSRGAAWHWTVDDLLAVQSFDHKFQLWQSGDGGGNGNNNSIAVEICVNRDGDYKKAVANGAALVRHIQKLEGIPSANIVQHNKWSGKDCPTELRAGKDGITWSDFLKMVSGATPSVTPVAPSKKPVSQQYTGDSIVDYLHTLNIDSSFDNRAKLAKQYGVANYKGTAAQNLALLKAMRSGKMAKATPKASPSSTPKVGQLVTLKKSATTFATGQSILPSVKGKTYKILQVKPDRVLLDKIMSWVKKSDIS